MESKAFSEVNWVTKFGLECKIQILEFKKQKKMNNTSRSVHMEAIRERQTIQKRTEAKDYVKTLTDRDQKPGKLHEEEMESLQ